MHLLTTVILSLTLNSSIQQTPSYKYEVDGYLRLTASSFTPNRFLGVKWPADPPTTLFDTQAPNANNPYVGKNDGFSLSDARVNLRALLGEKLYIRMGFDGAIASYPDSDSTVGHLTTGLKDAYVRYNVNSSTQLFAGRFKPPFDTEELTSANNRTFVHNSLESRGVKHHEGYHADIIGFAPKREIGIMLANSNLFELSTTKFGYAVALTNGNGGDNTINDNDLPALYFRLTNSWGETAKQDDEEGPATYNPQKNGGLIGLSTYVNQQTYGIPPNRFHNRVYGAGIDFAVNYFSYTLQGQLLMNQIEHLQTIDSLKEYSVGGHGQISKFFQSSNISLGYRLSWYNPRILLAEDSNQDSADYDEILHHTIGIKYFAKELPVIFLAEYTSSLESVARALPNNRVEVAMQVVFK